MKVLVIEDDPSLREIICRSLEKERYVTEEAPDFQTALEKTAVSTYFPSLKSGSLSSVISMETSS